MAAMLQQFLALCEATETFLQENSSAEAVQQNVENLLQGLERFRGRMEACSPQIVRALNSLRSLPSSDRSALMSKSTQLASEACQLASKSSFQDWTSLHQYVTTQLAEEVRSCGTNFQQVQILVGWAHKLGLRYASEGTFQGLTGLYLSFAGLEGISSAEKKAANDSVKSEFRKLSGIDAGEAYLSLLPPQPSSLLERRPAFYRKHFGENPTFLSVDPSQWNLGVLQITVLILLDQGKRFPTFYGFWPTFSFKSQLFFFGHTVSSCKEQPGAVHPDEKLSQGRKEAYTDSA